MYRFKFKKRLRHCLLQQGTDEGDGEEDPMNEAPYVIAMQANHFTRHCGIPGNA